MSPYAEVWHFTRARLAQAIEGLDDDQLRWRPHAQSHSIAELLFHIAGAEHYWAAMLARRDAGATDFEAKLDRAVREGFLRDGGCPFGEDEHTLRRAKEALDFAFRELRPIIEAPAQEQLEMRLESPIGDDVDGRTGLIRIAQHAGYHTGQIWMIRMMPGFPGHA